MTDIVLIQPPISDFYLTRKRTIPLGLASIAASLRCHGFSVKIIDSLAANHARDRKLPKSLSHLEHLYKKEDVSPFSLFSKYRHFGYGYETIAKKAKALKPRIIGISSLFSAYAESARKTAEALRSSIPDAVIVAGGHHPTALPEAVLKWPCIDYVLRGEAELSFPVFARALLNNTDLEQVPGIGFWNTDGSLFLDAPAYPDDLDAFPLPALDLVNQRYYARSQAPAHMIAASRGCPLHCTYCAFGREYPPFRMRSRESVIQEMKLVCGKSKKAFIDFEDENLSISREWFSRLLFLIQKEFRDKTVELRAMNGLYPPSVSDREVLIKMEAAGFTELNLSVGSTHKEELRYFNRKDVSRDICHIAENRGNMRMVSYLIAGAPSQSPVRTLEDILFLADLDSLVGVSVFYPAPNSRIFAEWETNRKEKPDHPCFGDAKERTEAKMDTWRSSALPLASAGEQVEILTLLRISRMVNFMKYLRDEGIPLPKSLKTEDAVFPGNNRIRSGISLLACFLRDGKIRGITRDNRVFEHETAEELADIFRKEVAGD